MARRKKRTMVRRRKSPKRVAAGKKAARTRTRRGSMRKRKNPARQGSFSSAAPLSSLQASAKAAGIKASGTKSQIVSRLNAAEKRAKARGAKGPAKKAAPAKKTAAKKSPAKKTAAKKSPAKKKKKTTRRKMTRAEAAAKGRRARRVTGSKVRSARSVIKRNKGKKTKAARAKRGVARTYMRARGIAKRTSTGRMPAGAAKLARAYGLTRVNPTGVKGAFKDLRSMFVPTILPATGGFVGAAVLGQMAGTKISEMKFAQNIKSAGVRSAIIPLSTLGITLITFAALKKTKGNAQRAAMPVLIGGGIATIVHTLLHTKMGQDLASKLKLPLALKEATEAQVQQGAEDAEKMANGETAGSLSGYMTVSQYLGAATPISAMGPSFYGRGDISTVGDYVDSGPQEAFGGYMASDFPVHTPGPGDNTSVHASLSGFAGAYPPGGYGAYNDPALPDLDYSLEETPGGTIVMPMGEAGIFGGKTALG